MNLTIRKTNKNEYYNTEYITREAFWNLYEPGSSEHFVLHQLRKCKSYVEDLDLVAISDDKIIGHIILTKAQVIDNDNNKYEVLCLGPVCVLPLFQSKGIGSKLINYSISEAKSLGYKGIILFGDPDYYHRFGFINAKKYGIVTRDGNNFDPFMVLELQKNGLINTKGKFFEDDAFITKEDELKEFEKSFPEKKKGKPKVKLSKLAQDEVEKFRI